MLYWYSATLFVSAFLLFLVQPMVGKMILPTMGGAPAVWNTCMVFFQAALLAGYAYAHSATSWLGTRRQAALHLVLLLTPLVVLPIAMNMADVPTADDNPVFWLLGRLIICVGLPFFFISTNAPLLQRWFAETGHAQARDPYFLYSASNLGSFLALVGYPLLVEPLFTVREQSRLWAAGYVLMIIMALGCALIMWRSPRQFALAGKLQSDSSDDVAADNHRRLTIGRRLRWILLAFVPSSLMLGVTTHITTEIAPAPLLWVLPLALYLLTFVFVFARRQILPRPAVIRVFPFLVAITGVITVQSEVTLGFLPLPLHLATYFLAAMLCHGALAEDRPSARHLTEFYLLMSVGGVLGGLCNAIVAPLLFDTTVEYPFVMVLACVALQRRLWMPRRPADAWLNILLPLGVAAATAALLFALVKADLWNIDPTLLSVLVPAGLCLLLVKRPLRFGLALGATMLVIAIGVHLRSDDMLYVGRNFYGVKRVISYQDDHFHVFAHGSTNHGIQSTHPKGRLIPRAYFHPSGPIGDVFQLYNTRTRQHPVAVLGLGVAAMAAYSEPGQEFDFYEIDPEVARIATNPDYFTYLADAKGKCDIILGDGRLKLAEVPDAKYDIIFLDAFSSDAVPTHLLTREALDLYLSKLRDDGFLVFNVSNRYLKLRPLLGNLAADLDLVSFARVDNADTELANKVGKFPSKFVVIARRPSDILYLVRNPQWHETPTDPRIGVWTDQFSNVLSVVAGLH